MAKSKYKKNFPARAGKYARDGMIDREIAAKLGISEPTYHVYQKKYPKFFKSIERGKIPVNVQVEKALLKRALGYNIIEKTSEYEKPEKGKPILKSIKKVKKEIVPDVTAEKFWLSNRDPERWREKKQLEVEIKKISLKNLKKSLGELDKDEELDKA